MTLNHTNIWKCIQPLTKTQGVDLTLMTQKVWVSWVHRTKIKAFSSIGSKRDTKDTYKKDRLERLKRSKQCLNHL